MSFPFVSLNDPLVGQPCVVLVLDKMKMDKLSAFGVQWRIKGCFREELMKLFSVAGL